MENAKKMRASEPANLDAFAEELSNRLNPARPNSFFRSALKARLARSKIFARRKAAGAVSVLWLIAALLVVVFGEIIYAIVSRGSTRAPEAGQR